MMSKYAFYGIIIQCCFITMLLASNGSAQGLESVKDVIVSVQLDDDDVMTAFEKIEAVTNFRFAFRQTDFDKKIKLNGKWKNESVYDVLLEISKQSKLQFKQVNNNINVKPLNRFGNRSRMIVANQERTITGKITADDAPTGLPGVNVIVKGTNAGTVTDIDGNYSIDVPSNESILVYSSVGYVKEEVTVGNQSVINMTMTPDITSLEELVVIGYGTQKKKDLTGSVASVQGKSLKEVTISSIENSLQGRVAGVQVTQNSAAPGAAMNINIRGFNTLQGNAQPLYVIDGIPVLPNNDFVASGDRRQTGNNPMATLNPNEIESIDILKDASATAIYGSRGANGVIIITTKRGKAGRMQIDLESSVGFQFGLKKYDVLETPDFIAWSNEDARNDGDDLNYTNADSLNAIQTNTDWQEEILNNGAPIQNYHMTVSGGNEKIRYSVVGGYFDQEGFLKSSRFERYSLRSNLDVKLSDKINVGHNLSFSRVRTDAVLAESGAGLEGPVNAAIIWRPDIPVFIESEGRYGDITLDGPSEVLSEGKEENPVAALEEITNELFTNRFLGSVYAEWEMIEGLKLRTSLNADYSNSERNFYASKKTALGNERGGFAGLYSANYLSVLNENTLTYSRYFGADHHINAVVGFTAQQNNVERQNIENQDFKVEVNRAYGIASGTQVPSLGINKSKETYLSYLGRLVYTLKDRYILTFTARADGSSKFWRDDQWGYFPAAAFAWRASDESFMQNQAIFSNLKFRASWGQSGFQEIGPYGTLASYANRNYAFGGREVAGYFVNDTDKPGVGWQTTTQTNIGLDVGILDDRVSFTADWYDKTSEDLLIFVPVPPNTGYSTILKNIGELSNTGLELSTNAIIINQPEFNWNFGGNISFNQTEVVELGEVERFFGPNFNNRRQSILVEPGQAPGLFYGHPTDGIFDNEEDVNTWENGAQAGTSEPGERRFIDVDEDGEITSEDREVIGNPYPDFIYGFNTSLSYKNFNINILFQGSQGNDIMNVNAMRLYGNSDQKNILTERYENRWTTSNTDAPYPKAGANNVNNDYMEDWIIEDGSYLRLKSINVSYDIPLNNEMIRRLNVYVRGENLLTFTNYSGYNPDVNSLGGSGAFTRGVDFGGYPLPKMFTVGAILGL